MFRSLARSFSTATRTVITLPNAPAIGPYSHAIRRNNDLYVSGQLGVKDGALVSEKVDEQARQALINLKAVVEAGGSSMDQVMKCTVFLVDMNDFAAINKVYAEFFPSNAPARSCVAVKALPRGGLFEVEAIANVPN